MAKRVRLIVEHDVDVQDVEDETRGQAFADGIKEALTDDETGQPIGDNLTVEFVDFVETAEAPSG
jgi:hypothetical protein